MSWGALSFVTKGIIYWRGIVCYCSLTVQNYNFRSYAVRRIKEDFCKNKTLEAGSPEQEKVLEFARQQLDVLYRQMIVSKLYPPHAKSVMETIG